MIGRVTINRSLLEDDIYLQKPFSKGQAWIDLILLANFKDTAVRIRGIEIPLQRGQLARSQRNLYKRRGRSDVKFYNYMEYLKKQEQIQVQTNNVTSVITINNYDKYQNKQTQTQDEKQAQKQAENQDQKQAQTQDSITKITKITKNIPPKNVYSEIFETFRKEYPNKKGKLEGYESWQKAIGETPPEVIIEGAKKYAARCKSTNTLPSKMKHPEGRLNNRRWEDEIIIDIGGPNYEDIQTFHNARKAEKIDDIKQFFQKKYGESRKEKYQQTKKDRTQSPLYTELFK